MIKDILLLPYIDLNTEYYDLGLENRDKTNDQVTVGLSHGHQKIRRCRKVRHHHAQCRPGEEYHLKEMWKSPNATIRAILDGTVFRTPILVRGITPFIPGWKKAHHHCPSRLWRHL